MGRRNVNVGAPMTGNRRDAAERPALVIPYVREERPSLTNNDLERIS